MDNAGLHEKQRQFNAAMARYQANPGYRLFGTAVAVANVALQLWLLWRLGEHPLGTGWRVLALGGAWVAADFVNGLVHLYMDNNDRYDGPAGPLVANFHLHHKQPLYTKRPLTVVYFVESGSKVWLVPCLALLAIGEATGGIGAPLLHFLVYCGILSSLAEVSHYLCHTSMAPLTVFLGKSRLLLDKRHHGVHHLQDNRNYAFLNGMTDPLLNWIATQWGRGYKEHTDRHYAVYVLEGESR